MLGIRRCDQFSGIWPSSGGPASGQCTGNFDNFDITLTILDAFLSSIHPARARAVFFSVVVFPFFWVRALQSVPLLTGCRLLYGQLRQPSKSFLTTSTSFLSLIPLRTRTHCVGVLLQSMPLLTGCRSMHRARYHPARAVLLHPCLCLLTACRSMLVPESRNRDCRT